MALDFVAGCIGGVAGVFVGHPFDTVKVRLQTQSSNNLLYRGTLHCFSSIIKQESLLGLYKGISSPLYGLTFINSIVFGIQRNIQRRLPHPNTVSSHVIAGAVAGTAQTIICSPMELAKTIMQLQGTGESRKKFKSHHHTYSGPIDCLWKLYQKQGLRRGVFRGFGITVCREAPGFGIYFGAYEYLCHKLTPHNPNDPCPEASPAVLLFSGGAAGVLSWVVAYPLDVIKSRYQADAAVDGIYRYKGYWDCYKKSVKQEGYNVLTRGLNSTILRAFPTNAATFTTVTLVCRYFSPDDNSSTLSDIFASKYTSHAEHIMVEESHSAR